MFDNSYDRGQPFPFQLGGGQVIPGWDHGLVGMKVGGRRELIIPPSLAYGAAGPAADDQAQRDARLRRRPAVDRVAGRTASAVGRLQASVRRRKEFSHGVLHEPARASSSSRTARPRPRRCWTPCASAPPAAPTDVHAARAQHAHGLHRVVDPEDQEDERGADACSSWRCRCSRRPPAGTSRA